MRPVPNLLKPVEKGYVPLGLLISGRGSNLQAVIEAIAAGKVRARAAVVISNRADAQGLGRAERAGIETLVLPHREAPSRDAYDARLVHELKSRGVELVCLAGFMRLLGPTFCDAFPNAIVNVHPSLLPAFPGVDAQQQALTAGATVSGATVHFVTPELDAGPIILQAAVPVHRTDTVATLSARILAEEHRILPEAIQLIAEGRCQVVGDRVVIAPPASDAARRA
ncbi:MAG: phosphoribosylglycinamide formyltransferase [Acidobacteria bacterium]|nr:MAG: phosphoribosylglycinamide formyltransferase [Acidobacteriota bacterium]